MRQARFKLPFGIRRALCNRRVSARRYTAGMRLRPLWITIGVLAMILLGSVWMWTAAKRQTPAFLRTPAPAFETLVRAGSRIQDPNPSPSSDELAAYIATNAAALATVREALTKPFEAPAAMYDIHTMNTSFTQVGGFKKLALMLKNEGTHYENQGKMAEAGRCYADVIRLGLKVERGPLIFMLIGVSFERIGLEALEAIEPKIPARARKELSAGLREMNSQRVPFAEIEERERYIRRRHSPTPFHYLIFAGQARAGIVNAQNKYEPAWQYLDALASKLDRTPAAPKEN